MKANPNCAVCSGEGFVKDPDGVVQYCECAKDKYKSSPDVNEPRTAERITRGVIRILNQQAKRKLRRKNKKLRQDRI